MKAKWIFVFCLAGAAVCLVLGLALHWLFWIAMALLIAAGILLRK